MEVLRWSGYPPCITTGNASHRYNNFIFNGPLSPVFQIWYYIFIRFFYNFFVTQFVHVDQPPSPLHCLRRCQEWYIFSLYNSSLCCAVLFHFLPWKLRTSGLRSDSLHHIGFQNRRGALKMCRGQCRTRSHPLRIIPGNQFISINLGERQSVCLKIRLSETNLSFGVILPISIRQLH